MRLLGCLAAVLLFVIAAETAQAQAPPTDHDAQARHLFESGRSAYEESRYADALTLFRQSYELSGRPELLFNIGQCEDRLRHDRAAVQAFESYLAALPAAENRREVETRLTILRANIASGPSPADVARTDAAAHTAPPPPPVQHGGSVFDEWWFWTIVGAVVVGATITAVVLATSHTEQPPAGDVGPGGIVIALGSP